jgi:hypothetical protein
MMPCHRLKNIANNYNMGCEVHKKKKKVGLVKARSINTRAVLLSRPESSIPAGDSLVLHYIMANRNSYISRCFFVNMK